MKKTDWKKQLKEVNASLNEEINLWIKTDINLYSKISYNDLLTEFTIYADASKFTAQDVFYTVLGLEYLSDSYQALNLIDVKDRSFKLTVLNQDTNEVLYSK